MASMAKSVRPPAVAGTFYPSRRSNLLEELNTFLADAKAVSGRPKALVVPHAGYVYSGPIAATAYALVGRMHPKPTKVVLFGPGHTVAFDGLALPEAAALATPLGEVPLDDEGLLVAGRLPQVRRSDFVHEREHSLEVQLPFLQRVLSDGFSVLPFAVGRATPSEVAEVMDALWGGDETLLVVSSDLSHYLPYDEARLVDRATAKAVEALDFAGLDDDAACGATPMRGLLLAARQRSLAARVLDLRNSGDTAGSHSRVVGYGAFGFFPAEGPTA